jgi:diaminohydroxyphosphoribosylaminopyrimidine deaminase / 5-amino-6-(5-phosphoribosylamino)uracil reductase
MINAVSSADDTRFMRRCFALARLGLAAAAPNPSVGAVIVHQNRIIGEGCTSPYGGAHAEVNAVASASEADRVLFAESTLYVSLEPCHHFGKTPPCVDLVLRCGFRRVVIGNTDPNPLVAGKSIAKLQAANVAVRTGILKAEGRRLNADFFCFFEQKRPRIILKWAESTDGFIGKPNEQIWLTSPESKQLVHEWRSQTMAIMVGANTVLVDNPALTTRLVAGKSPLRITFFRALPDAETIKKWQLYDAKAQTVVFSLSEKTTELEDIEHNFFKIIVLKNTTDADILKQLLDFLYENKINSLMVEGGSKLLELFFVADLWDEIRCFKTKKILETGVAAPPILEKINFEKTKTSVKNIGGDVYQCIIK